ncbi:hypothetical protein GDO78_022966 [Eleutherodactylus coqui]|uniref:Uncharacterized protein n=1 Tax=Eleutherodactylus coqui TaxID=57060 RepID=A0A8J6JY75_ELECQ|nr:hypothetical protein GDO78_022966 [Eleutherodactylus coqui]
MGESAPEITSLSIIPATIGPCEPTETDRCDGDLFPQSAAAGPYLQEAARRSTTSEFLPVSDTSSNLNLRWQHPERLVRFEGTERQILKRSVAPQQQTDIYYAGR